MGIRLIATDLDGTLLSSATTVSERTRRAVTAAQRAGIVVVPATGRPIVAAPELIPASMTRLMVCTNGAIAYDHGERRVLLERTIAPAVQADFVDAFSRALPGLAWAAVTDSGHSFRAGPGYLTLMRQGDHGRNRSIESELDLAGVVSEPAVKLIARHPVLDEEELLVVARELAHPGVNCTTSGVPFLEIAAAGVSKESTLSLIADALGILPAETMAFGDSGNDLGMLRWAGRGVAMGNAIQAAQEAADLITATNNEDGVALVIERLLAEQFGAAEPVSSPPRDEQPADGESLAVGA